jgi:outer membrane protein TolC
MALRGNKQLAVARLKQDVATNLRKSARTKYLPHVSALGTYEYNSREVSLLSGSQQQALSSLGTTVATGLQGSMSGLAQGFNADMAASMTQVGGLLTTMGFSPAAVQQLLGTVQQGMTGMENNLQGKMQTGLNNLAQGLNDEGQKIVDAFRTDTRNIWAGSVTAIQPVFLGGSIVALNRLAKLNEELMANQAEARQQLTLYNTDQAYWQVVSLRHKQRLAESYLKVVQKLDSDVQKMIAEGVATRSEGLSVSVKVSAAEMTLQKVEDGLTLSRMLLCQMIGLPSDENIVLEDELLSDDTEPGKGSSSAVDGLVADSYAPLLGSEAGVEARPELRALANGVEMSRQVTNILRAGNLPQVALMGGYAVSNPNLLNGFEKKFGGFWNVGLLVRVPLWNWGDVSYKVRASKGATAIASLELEEVREKIGLQVSQSEFRVTEAGKRLAMAEKSIRRAEENLRTANIGFSEGVITPTVVMEAQTAWLQARSEQIDARIDVMLSLVDLKKAKGELRLE